ncbi:MAG: hypothetical protein NV1_28 [Nanoarchaeotal virus 1]|nr:MAG: hypothetical protein NV1_28 [Nanoarchaeotal virus 1]
MPRGINSYMILFLHKKIIFYFIVITYNLLASLEF